MLSYRNSLYIISQNRYVCINSGLIESCGANIFFLLSAGGVRSGQLGKKGFTTWCVPQMHTGQRSYCLFVCLFFFLHESVYKRNQRGWFLEDIRNKELLRLEILF